MYNLQFLEKETYAERTNNKFDPNAPKIYGSRYKLFTLIEVPKTVIEHVLFSKQTVQVRGIEMKTFESLRSFDSLPKWLKKRMKFRLKNLAQYPELEKFVTNL